MKDLELERYAASLPVRIIRSARKTMALEVRQGELLIRVPLRVSEARIRQFVIQHKSWIERQADRVRQISEETDRAGMLSEEQIRDLADKAARYIPERAAYYAGLIGVTYGRITIRCQKTRWGSCSAKGNLNFNCLLMLMPPEVIDSVVVHELCHRKEMNHSERFYREVLRVFPDYRKWHGYLKRNGRAILARNPRFC